MIPKILETPTNMTVTVLMDLEQFNSFIEMLFQQMMDDEYNEGFRNAVMDASRTKDDQ